jgi:hypothetical protein
MQSLDESMSRVVIVRGIDPPDMAVRALEKAGSRPLIVDQLHAGSEVQPD